MKTYKLGAAGDVSYLGGLAVLDDDEVPVETVILNGPPWSCCICVGKNGGESAIIFNKL